MCLSKQVESLGYFLLFIDFFFKASLSYAWSGSSQGGEPEPEEMCSDAPEPSLSLKRAPEPSCHDSLWQKRPSGW